MPSRSFSDLTKRLSPNVPGCPWPVIENAIRDAAIEACERTLAWRYIQPSITLTPGIYDYPYEIPTGTEVHAFITSTVNDRDILPVTLEEAQRRYPYWPSSDTDDQSFPQRIVHFDADNFYVAPAPDSATTYLIQMTLALKPLRTADNMDQTAFDELEETIVHGALQRLFVIPDMNWSDKELAAYHAKQYIFKYTGRRARVNLGAGRASLTAQMNPFV